MNICISRKGCESNNVSIAEALLMLAIANKADLSKAQESLIDKGYITALLDEKYHPVGWRLTSMGAKVIDSVVIDSEKVQEPEDRLDNLAKELKQIFPKGRKPGTNYYWAEGVALIVRRLKLFFKKYGNSYSDEQIIKAAKKYVEGFNGNYAYMRLLKYFIFKEKTNAAGEVEGDSELVSYIENDGEDNGLSLDWASELR